MMKKISFEDALILNTARSARFIFRFLPPAAALAVARGIGFLVYLMSKRRPIAMKNVRSVFAGELDRRQMKRIARQSFGHVAMTAVEMLRFPEMDKRYLEERIKITGLEKFERALASGRGIIFLSAHFGNWEILNVVAGLKGYPLLALARAQKHPRSDAFLNGLRSSQGAQMIGKGMPVREILRALKSGRIIGILGDQDAGKTGTFVRFFGRLSSSPTGAEVFAERTHALIFPIFVSRQGRGHLLEIEEPLEGDVLQKFANRLEEKIRAYPSQWLWAHRRWKSSPDRFVVVLSDGKAGHYRQSMAAAEVFREQRARCGIADERTRVTIIDVRYKNPFLRRSAEALCILCRGHVPFPGVFYQWVLEPSTYQSIIANYADAVISCGSSLVGVNLFVKKENSAKSLVIHKPSVPVKRFNAVIVPLHDHLTAAENVFVTSMALSSKPQSTGAPLAQGKKHIGFLVGNALTEGLAQAVGRAGEETQALLLITSSRRTPAAAEALLKKTFADTQRCPLLVIANQSNPAGTMEAILIQSDLFIVSGESVSMVSEAVAGGKPVLVFLPSGTPPKAKVMDFLSHLSDQGKITIVTPETLPQAASRALSESSGNGHRQPSGDEDAIKQAVRRIS
ncbi:MAG: mitochondrial fission ELM1 family protein [Candidatus Omnitrophica bacterium]|nr:mitochondrial fission ELM1 family protein [Candidatus Omnitrophota bacterium]